MVKELQSAPWHALIVTSALDPRSSGSTTKFQSGPLVVDHVAVDSQLSTEPDGYPPAVQETSTSFSLKEHSASSCFESSEELGV